MSSMAGIRSTYPNAPVATTPIKDNERSQKYSIPCKAPFHTGEPTGIDRLHHDMRCKGTQQQSDQEVGRAGIVPKQDKTQPETTYRCNQERIKALGYLECKGILRRLAFSAFYINRRLRGAKRRPKWPTKQKKVGASDAWRKIPTKGAKATNSVLSQIHRHVEPRKQAADQIHGGITRIGYAILTPITERTISSVVPVQTAINTQNKKAAARTSIRPSICTNRSPICPPLFSMLKHRAIKDAIPTLSAKGIYSAVNPARMRPQKHRRPANWKRMEQVYAPLHVAYSGTAGQRTEG